MADNKTKKKVTNNSRKIPAQNYIIAAVIVALVIGLTFYIFQWINVVKEDKLATSYLVSTNTIVYEIKSLEEVNSVFVEMPSEYFVYISNNNDEQIYELEKDLKKIIDDYGLKDYFYYINITNMKEKSDYIKEIENALAIKEGTIKRIPTIIMFRDGEIVTDGIVIREDQGMITAADFEKLLEIKEIKKIQK